MTVRQAYAALLTELNKVDAPNILLEDFVYYMNKAIVQYVNKKYNVCETNQQAADDIRVLNSKANLNPQPVNTQWDDGIYEVNLPTDYLHILNCICTFHIKSGYRCNKGEYYSIAAKRVTSDAWPVIMSNYYHKPSYKRPYFCISNVNTSNEIPTNPYIPGTLLGEGTDTNIPKQNPTSEDISKLERAIKQALLNTNDPIIGDEKGFIKKSNSNQWLHAFIEYNGSAYAGWTSESNRLGFLLVPYSEEWLSPDFKYPSDHFYKMNDVVTTVKDKILNAERVNLKDTAATINLSRTLDLSDGSSIDLVERQAGIRYGNTTPVRLEIRCGNDNDHFELVNIQVTYIKTPQYIDLTPDQLDIINDGSQMLEFPDYVCQEIINELVHIVMEHSGDPRLQTHVPVSQSIAQPTQQQTA